MESMASLGGIGAGGDGGVAFGGGRGDGEGLGEGGGGSETGFGSGGGGCLVSGSGYARPLVCGKICRGLGGGTGATACSSEVTSCCQFRLASFGPSSRSGVEVLVAVVLVAVVLVACRVHTIITDVNATIMVIDVANNKNLVVLHPCWQVLSRLSYGP